MITDVCIFPATGCVGQNSRLPNYFRHSSEQKTFSKCCSRFSKEKSTNIIGVVNATETIDSDCGKPPTKLVLYDPPNDSLVSEQTSPFTPFMPTLWGRYANICECETYNVNVYSLHDKRLLSFRGRVSWIPMCTTGVVPSSESHRGNCGPGGKW